MGLVEATARRLRTTLPAAVDTTRTGGVGFRDPTPLELGGMVVAGLGATVALLSLLTAWAGIHDGLLVLVGSVLLVVGVAVVLARRTSVRPAPWSWTPALVLAGILALAASQFFPGFPLAAKNRDPGVYVNHAVAIAEQGSTRLTDPVARTGAEIDVVDGQAVIHTEA